jgi:hypothetical protein
MDQKRTKSGKFTEKLKRICWCTFALRIKEYPEKNWRSRCPSNSINGKRGEITKKVPNFKIIN